MQFAAASENEKRSVDEFIKKQEPVQTDFGTKTAMLWRVGENSTSYSDSTPLTTFSWELLQIEELKIETLAVGELELRPYKYHEDFGYKDVLTIFARVELTEPEEEQLHKQPVYFQVVRKGVNDVPREMRFGQMLWSKKEGDEKRRVQLILVDKAFDDDGPHRGFMEPQFGNVAATAAAVRTSVSALLDKLVTKGVLSDEEAALIRVVGKESIRKELWENDRVDDLDEWLKNEH